LHFFYRYFLPVYKFYILYDGKLILYLIIQISMLGTDGFFDRTQQYGIGLVTFDTALSEKHFDGLTIFASCVALSTVNPQVKL